jgi:hypothetical protein
VRRPWLTPLVVSTLAVVAAVVPVAGQQPAPPTAAGCPVEPVQFHACAVPKMRAFNPPRTADGRPNMQGYWNRSVTSQDIEDHVAGFGTQAGPSLVIDTPDRRIPYQPWALAVRQGITDRYISPLAACSPPGVPRHVYAPGGHQIVQTPGYFVHLLEYAHSYRIIPTTARPHVANTVRLYQGNSRGRWEGNSLVVDVTNANGLTWFDNAGNFSSDALHVVERFTLVDADTIHYESRVTDPQVYTRPWTMVFALTRNGDRAYELWEQACHEGNRSVEGGVESGLNLYRGVVPPAR